MTAAKRALALVPGIGISLLPKLTCPMCWPVYAALLTAAGLGFLISARYLFVFTACFLFLAVGALAFRARGRRGYGPAIVGGMAGLAVLVGKFYLESSPTMYAGLALLVATSFWNAWPLQRPAESLTQLRTEENS